MKSRVRHHLKERLKRVEFIKKEIFNVVNKSLLSNNYVKHTTKFVSDANTQQNSVWGMYLSRHRLWCPVNSSPKVVNKNYRLSRFSLNEAARANQISGLLKRGW